MTSLGFRHQKGQIAVIMTLVMAVLLGVIALGTDVALMYYNWGLTQKAVDAAALAGASYLNGATFDSTNIPSQCSGYSTGAEQAACTYAVLNGLAISSGNFKVYTPGQNLPSTVPTPNIQVWAQQSNLPYFFGRLVGLSTYNVSAIASAADPPISSYNGKIFPVVYNCGSPCSSTSDLSGFVSFGSKFIGGSSSGNWQFVDAGQGTGGSALKSAISGGTSVSLTIGTSTMTTDTGVDVGNVTQGWNTLMSEHTTYCNNSLLTPSCWDPTTISSGSCPSGTYDGAPNDPLLVTVPVASIPTSGCIGSCTMTVEGFVHVYLTGLTQDSGCGVNPCWNITGCFVQVPETQGGGTNGSSGAPALGTNVVALIQ